MALLRRGHRSVDDLAAELGITDNAVRAQLLSLARDGVVTDAGPRREGLVGKPPTFYGVADDAEVAFSSAYAPTLATLLEVLGERHTHAQLNALMREVGKRLGAKADSSASTLGARVNAAVAFLGELGAVADIERDGKSFVMRGYGCPLATAVRARPEACRAVEQLLAETTRADVHEQCDRTDGHPRCSFKISARPSTP